MKILLLLLCLIAAAAFWFYTSKNKNLVKAPNDFVMINTGKETNKHLPLVDAGWILSLEQKYASKPWKAYPNEYTDQSEILCNQVYEPWKGEVSHATFMSDMTNEQKLYFALINFESQTNNGGVYQFLFNYPELAIIALEAMEQAKMPRLANDYRKVLNEYFGKFDTIKELNNRFQDGSSSWDKQWNAFADGYKELTTTDVIEDYFYKKEFIKEFSEAMVGFVKDNQESLYKVK